MKQTKKFTMSYPELGQRGDRVKAVLERDVLEFMKYGYDDGIAETVRVKTEQFKAILPDMYWEGQKTLTTNNKEQLKGKLVEMLGEMAFKGKLALGSNSKEYATFRFSGMNRLTDQELVVYSKHVCKTAELYQEALAKRNIDGEMITLATEATTALDNAIDAQTEAIAVREQMSVKRFELGNELYDLIVELCEVGKRIWENTNEAFYHDYVLYGSNKSANEIQVTEEEADLVNSATE
ncbi:hypothetical protein [Ancylomarina longa]|uniref:Uncharacterized protein n=1 Tax=Ancylomarina longa TaxID=2487017 RepID=A0A434AVA4_9BACT|nr:hypothetical protein [Ancylomarina longa]RUT78401.1 hypothetical protein DLK05_08745 [Ancylomarina longa]